MADTQSKAESHDELEAANRLDLLAEEFAARMRSGERPAISEYVARHPELADEINAMFPTLALLEQIGNEGSLTGGRSLSMPAHEQLGEYRIVREIGRGGMGVVYEAEHTSMRRRVALKVMPVEMANHPTHLRRFRREARAAGGLHHTNIVPVFEVGQHEGIHFYAMQYIRGQSLDLVIKDLRKLAQGTWSGRTEPAGEMDDTAPHGPMDSVAARLLSGFSAGNSSATDASEFSAARNAHGPEAPRSLASEPRRDIRHESGVFTPAERMDYYRRVARLGLQVADALAYAHGQGILHRDIKPSNLILDTAGIIWITDFGLAKHDEDDLTRTGDIVGTLRYLAPERLNGQADARGDVYALGLTLYELCTWRPAFDESDRVRLIKQITSEHPPAPRRISPHIPRDLETIILKAIEKHPAGRYQTAEQLADDLRLFVADRPVNSRRIPVSEKLYRWCRRNPVVATLAASVGLLLAVLCAASIWYGIHSKQQAEALRNQASMIQHSEREALGALYEARRAHARAARFSGRRGQRVEGLQALHEAATLLPRLSMPPPDRAAARSALRNDAIASLAIPDLRTARSWTVVHPWTTVAAFDPEFQRFAQADAEGNVVIRQVADNQELMRLPSPGWPAWEMKFSPDGKFLAVKYHPARARPQQIAVWDLATEQAVIRESDPLLYAPFAFSADSRMFFACTLERHLHIYDLPDGRLRDDPPQLAISPLTFAVDPSGDSLVVSDASSYAVQRIDLKGEILDQIACKNYIRSFAYSPDGSLVFGGGEDFNIYVWNSHDLNQAPRILTGHSAAVVQLFANHAGNRLMSYGWDGTARLWDLQTDSQLVRVDAVRLLGPQFSTDDRFVAYASKRNEVGIWEALDRGPVQLLTSPAEVRTQATYFPRTPNWALSGTSDGVEIWETATRRLVGCIPAGPVTTGLALPDESAIISCGEGGIHKWPVHRSESVWRIGPAERLSSKPTKRIDLDSQGRFLTAIQDQQILAFDLLASPPVEVTIGVHQGAHQIEISPDGKWIISTTWQNGSDIKIWDRESRECIQTLEPEMGAATATFSPDGHWLATCVWKHFAVWKTGSWELQYRIERPLDDDWSPTLAFTPDSKLFACLYNRRSVQLIDTSSGERLAIMESPDPGMIGDVDFNPEGNELAAVTDERLLVWKLDQLADELAAIDLGWDSPQFKPSARDPESPPRIEFVGVNPPPESDSDSSPPGK